MSLHQTVDLGRAQCPRSRHLGTFDSRRNRWAKRIAHAHDILACALVFGLVAYLALVM